MAKSKDKAAKGKKKGRIGAFFRGVLSELKKTNWPSKKQVANYTGVVITFVLIMTAVLFVVDSILGFGIQGLITKFGIK